MIYKFVAANIRLWHVICGLAQFEISAGFGADMKEQTKQKKNKKTMISKRMSSKSEKVWRFFFESIDFVLQGTISYLGIVD